MVLQTAMPRRPTGDHRKLINKSYLTLWCTQTNTQTHTHTPAEQWKNENNIQMHPMEKLYSQSLHSTLLIEAQPANGIQCYIYIPLNELVPYPLPQNHIQMRLIKFRKRRQI